MNKNKNIRIHKKGSEPDDTDYWADKTDEQRIDALEKIREEYIKINYEKRPEFQRVYRIIKRKQS